MTGLSIDKVHLLPFIKSDDYDYQSALSNKLYNMNKKNKDFSLRFTSEIMLANEIGEELLKNYSDLFSETKVIESGFLLIRLSDNLLLQELNKIIKNDI